MQDHRHNSVWLNALYIQPQLRRPNHGYEGEMTSETHFLYRDKSIPLFVLHKNPNAMISLAYAALFFSHSSPPTCRPAVLDVSSFERLMGPCIEVMLREAGSYFEQIVEILGENALLEHPQLKKLAADLAVQPNTASSTEF
ncbi:unnamed protein product [Protopolystoma xenopodis]|uniref:Uncharacterized protein n=1 Tax=Protopolystoma xenopodis TaxID=117903 RepID=A0A3S5BX76_9PLAT|nr:unnamed protein product [Protopolystoma xenopodis]